MSMPNSYGYGGYRSGYRRAYTPRYGGSGRVSVGRTLVFSQTPRAGFYPKQTRVGLRYVKRRTY